MLATASGQTANEVSKKIISEFVTRRLMGNSHACHGCTIADCVTSKIKLFQVVQVMTAAGIPNKSKYISALMDLVVVGEYDCPECGGQMDVEDGDYNVVRGDLMSQTDYIPIWEIKKCSHCGFVEGQAPELSEEK